jgi:KDEL-tailed cysteine endopeptidase
MFFQSALTVLFATRIISPYPNFKSWMNYYEKVYTPTERDYRNYIFNTNVERIYNHNRYSNSSWSMAVNKFADMTPSEWRSIYANGLSNNSYANRTYSRVLQMKTALPTSVDWTTVGAVTPIKDQGQCGSCWAFSATGALEGAAFLKNGNLYNMSEQQLIDCSTPEGNQGCNGGLMDNAFQYVIQAKGLTTDSSYPYTATGPNACMASGKPYVVTVIGFTDVVPNSETALMSAITEQPVSVAVEADQDSFQFYSSGVMTKACGTQLDHGVLAVGYGTLAGQDYYKVKNSWGSDWGMSGYILLGRGSAFGTQGQCGIQMAASFPLV